ncbi:MAG: DUF2155 domain-containing protein [Rhodospirillales bacterium]|nr:DUF2155 domain-containing protein [Rhodospirillales bacterium]MDE2320250.1 DUF2155 domain-containing protein [Rhodospirillales bacterium]
MRLMLLASAAMLIGGTACAQTMLGQSQPGQDVVVVPPAPPVVAGLPNAPEVPVAPQPALPPGLVQTPFPPPNAASGGPNAGNADNGDASPVQAVSPSAGPLPAVGSVPPAVAGTTPPASPDIAPVPADKWVAGQTAELGVLNKIDGSTKILTIPVGGQNVAGDLTVSVQACEMRPPGVLPDSAAFITLQSNAPQGGGSPVYRGWMVHSVPGATDAGDAGEAFRVITCS